LSRRKSKIKWVRQGQITPKVKKEEEMKYKILDEKIQAKRPLGKPTHRR
jgi:hypothetical protein